jgi:signal transduction histidine kinase
LQAIAAQLGTTVDDPRLPDRVLEALEEIRLLYETSQRINTAFDIDDVIKAYLEQVAARGHYACTIVLYEANDAGERVTRVIRGHWSPRHGLRQLNERQPYERDALDPLLDAGQTVTSADVYTDSRIPESLREIQKRAGHPGLAFIPMMVRGRRIGLIVLSSPTVHEWRAVDLQLYQATAAQLATAVDSRQQQLLFYKYGQQLAVLEERQNIARELHDAVSQVIFSLTLIAQTLISTWQRDPAQAQQRTNRILELSNMALVDIRRLLTKLRPPEMIPVPALPISHPQNNASGNGADGLSSTDRQSVAKVPRNTVADPQWLMQMRVALEEIRLLYATSRQLGAAPDLKSIIESYLDQVAEQGERTCSIVLYEFDEVGRRTAIAAYAHWSPRRGTRHVREYFPNQLGDIERWVESGATVAIANALVDPRVSDAVRQVPDVIKRPALAMIPLMVRGGCIGLVILASRKIGEWQNADLRPYQITAAQLASAIDNQRQQQRLYERDQQLAVLQERQRVARDLHDAISQLIFSIALIAQSLGFAWQRDPAEGARRTNRLVELSQTALAEMRAVLDKFDPAEPDLSAGEVAPPSPAGTARVQREGLANAIRKYAVDIAPENLKIQIDARRYVRQPISWELALYRIAQEAINNVVKSSQASRMKITLMIVDRQIRLLVQDNGRGFVERSQPRGFGLHTMRERAEAFGGFLQVTSAPGRGTVVKVTLPGREESPS